MNIEDLFSKPGPRPKRPLSANFTQSVKQEIRRHPQPAVWRKLYDTLSASLFTKAGTAVAAACLVLVTGSVAAIALWPIPDLQTTLQKPLPIGNHIIGYNAKNCNYFSSLNGKPPVEQSEDLYYEVRQGSSLSDQQLQNSLRAVCQENLSNNAMQALVKQLPNTQKVLTSMSYTITGIGRDYMTVSVDSHYDNGKYAMKPSVTYNKFSKDLQLYNQGNKTSFSDFKTGDTVKMVVEDSSGKSTETTEAYNPFDHPEHITVLAIVKTPALTADPDVFYTAVGKDLVRLEPCATSPTGFCRVYNFSN